MTYISYKGLPDENGEQQEEKISLDEIHSCGKTHSFLEYAHGQRPMFVNHVNKDVYNMFHAGRSDKEIALILSIPALTVRDRRVKMGLQYRAGTNHYTQEELKLAITHGSRWHGWNKYKRSYNSVEKMRAMLRASGIKPRLVFSVRHLDATQRERLARHGIDWDGWGYYSYTREDRIEFWRINNQDDYLDVQD